MQIPSMVTVRANGSDWLVKTDEMDEATKCSLFRAGLGIVLQRCTASLDSKTDAPGAFHKRIEEVIAALQSNSYDFGGGGGGKRLSEEEKELRLIVSRALVSSGHWKQAAADKEVAKDLPAAVTDLIKKAAVAQQKALSHEQLAALRDKYLAKWTREAREAIEARKAIASMELTLD